MENVSFFLSGSVPITSQGLTLFVFTISATVYVLAAFFFMGVLADDKGKCIPNGPVGLPIIGSFPSLSHYPELILDSWAKKFGPFYSMRLGNQLFVVVSDPLIAKDLLITNGSIFSSRKEMFIKSETIFHGRAITVMPNDARWNCSGPVSNLVDFVPFLQRLPNSLTNRAKKLHKDIVDTYGGMIGEIEKRMNSGQDVPRCLVKTLVEAGDQDALDHLDKVMICSAFVVGGVESIAFILQWFSAIMPSNPDIQAKAHAELDKVVGRNRLPTVDDEEDLPYIRAIIKEVERFRNPFWLSTPHVNTEDYTYQGQFIPKDTVVILNTYTMHHNAARYTDPLKFNPDRYLNDHMKSSESAHLANVMGRDHWTFGAGRRICPAIAVAERILWLAISRMLWAFKMEEVPGEPIDLKEYDGLSGRGGSRDGIVQPAITSAETAGIAHLSESSPMIGVSQRHTTVIGILPRWPNVDGTGMHWDVWAGRPICPAITVAEHELWLAISRMLWAFKMEEKHLGNDRSEGVRWVVWTVTSSLPHSNDSGDHFVGRFSRCNAEEENTPCEVVIIYYRISSTSHCGFFLISTAALWLESNILMVLLA
ncbi:hypothetical protein BS47DRAFT_1359550 [Hydnum rufescens UP504]|uniref:Cytochrome P450 n=1 Tax=Hydnum rufescens UP504 TaxID=1448309 RepID=A0A9P6DXJ3_9AGAM|nr:hypothetical protein BS47DRAFT_1359550 [Hydnum rufescens UP504]